MLKFVNNLVFVLILVFLPLSISWWLFLPFCLLAIFVSRNVYGPIVAGFILDLVNLGRFPIFLSFALAAAVLFLLLRDKIRALA